MANKRQKKKALKKLGTFENKQYTGGRSKGTPNLKKTATGNLKNQYGVEFTPDEKKQLESLVNTVNRKNNKMKKELGQLPRMVNGKPTGDTVSSLQLMGKESDFIIARKTKSLQRFRSRDQFDNYLERLKKVNSKNYLTERIRGYKRNFITSLRNVYSYDNAKDVIMKIKTMKPEEYMKLVTSNEELEIGYNYPDGDNGKLNTIRRALGMKEKDEDDYIDDI